jgi:Mg-chelatase subunit ChlD
MQRRLRQWLLLALRVTALVLLALAFARPFLRAASASRGRLTVVAIDTSLSMSAPAQLAQARQRAREVIRAAAGDVAVVTFSDSATVVVSPTSSQSTAASAVDAATAGFGSTNYRAALAAAADLFRGRSGKLVVVTDLQAPTWVGQRRARRVPAGVQVEVRMSRLSEISPSGASRPIASSRP